jgi:hypothetical protein
MIQKELTDLLSLKTYQLTSIIQNWKDFETDTIILTYLDLQRRQLNFSDEINSHLNEFISSQNKTMDQLTSDYLSKKNANNYAEYFDSIVNRPLTDQEKLIKEYNKVIAHKNYQKERDNGIKDIIIGSVVLVIGGVITIATLQSGSGYLTYGAIIFGFAKIAQGIYRQNQ